MPAHQVGTRSPVHAVITPDCPAAAGSVSSNPSQTIGIGDQVHLEDPIPADGQDANP